LSKVNGVEFVNKPLPKSKYSLKATNPMKAKGFTLHNTFNDASAANEIEYMQNNNPASTSFHYAVDNKGVIQGLPSDRNGWHAGDGVNGYGNRNTWGVEICYSKSGGERYDKAETNAIKFVAKGLFDNGWGVDKVKVWKHQDWSGKDCPHRILARTRGWEGIIKAIQKELDRLKGGSSKPSKKPTTTTSKPKPVKGIDTLAREVLAGKHGDGEDRKKSLGSRYSAVQKRVNELSKPKKKNTSKGIETLAREVIAGKHGNDAERRKSLGTNYSAVQKRVNEILKGKSKPKKSPAKKSLKQLVDEVNRGLHGNGEDRKKSLGSDYNRVQAEINRQARK